MAVCCQNLTLGALSSRSALSVLVGALFKKFSLVSNTPRILETHPIYYSLNLKLDGHLREADIDKSIFNVCFYFRSERNSYKAMYSFVIYYTLPTIR
jgi:hypothetical protein